MRFTTGLLLATTLATGIGTAERIIDPFERHAHDYTLEGPSGHSEVSFARSSNWYDDEGKKHDDRLGDLLIVSTIAGAAGTIALRLREVAIMNVATDQQLA